LDPVVTDTAMAGYYPAYLFNSDFDRIVLVLGQGTDSIRQEFGIAKAAVLLKSRAEVIRQKVPEYREWFQPGPFGVASREKAGEEWDISGTFGRAYEIVKMPDNETLAVDLRRMLDLYRLLSMRGGYTVEEDEDSDEDETHSKKEWKEGAARLRVHKRLERRRNSSLVKEVKRKQGYLCRGCGFNFRAVYGNAGAKYIDAHHLVPLAALTEDGPVARDPVKDFAVLCANCHRMIHKLKCPPLDEFKREIQRGYLEALSTFLRNP
jgi:5-methylcytosine-specific restriction protein A